MRCTTCGGLAKPWSTTGSGSSGSTRSTESIVPPELLEEAPDAETDDFMRRKHVAFEGISAVTGTSYTIYEKGGRPAAIAWRDRAVEKGELVELTVEGWRGPRWALAEDREAIETISAGRVPRGWKPKETTTTQEATFLAPLDPVSARKRAKPLFDFDYIWEVYTPAPKRKFGYYALPVLWGDRLVARFDGRFDRAASTFAILGLWLEDDALATDDAFIQAFARGIERMRDVPRGRPRRCERYRAAVDPPGRDTERNLIHHAVGALCPRVMTGPAR